MYELVIYNEQKKIVITENNNKIFVTFYKKIFMHENTVLIHINENDYVYVGNELYKFETYNEEIINFYCYVLNVTETRILCPVAIGKTNAYLLNENVCLENKYINFDKNIYLQYYGLLEQCNNFLQENVY